MAVNSRRNIMAAICVENEIAYHLFKINANPSPLDDAVKLSRKSKRAFQCSTSDGNLHFLRPSHLVVSGENYFTGLDFDPNGDVIAALDLYGTCWISDVTSNKTFFHLNMNINSNKITKGTLFMTSQSM